MPSVISSSFTFSSSYFELDDVEETQESLGFQRDVEKEELIIWILLQATLLSN